MTSFVGSVRHTNTMNVLLLLILLRYLLVNGVVGTYCGRVSRGGKKKCCMDFELKNGACVPCIGTFGDNCSGGPCKEGYYGFGCKRKCNCSSQQQCDKIIGCTTANTWTLVRQSEEEKVYSGSGIAISILSILLVISVGFNVLMKCRMSSRYIGNTEQANTHAQTGLENYDNLSDTRERHLYTTMTATA